MYLSEMLLCIDCIQIRNQEPCHPVVSGFTISSWSIVYSVRDPVSVNASDLGLQWAKYVLQPVELQTTVAFKIDLMPYKVLPDGKDSFLSRSEALIRNKWAGEIVQQLKHRQPTLVQSLSPHMIPQVLTVVIFELRDRSK